MNNLYLYKHPSTDRLCLAIGDGNSKRRVWISEDEANKLAYRLMALAAGGETFGMEKFDAIS